MQDVFQIAKAFGSFRKDNKWLGNNVLQAEMMQLTMSDSAFSNQTEGGIYFFGEKGGNHKIPPPTSFHCFHI